MRLTTQVRIWAAGKSACIMTLTAQIQYQILRL